MDRATFLKALGVGMASAGTVLDRLADRAAPVGAGFVPDEDEIRNVIGVKYYDGLVLTEDRQSIARYGRRMMLVEDGSIRTSQEAERLASAMLADLAA